MTLAGHSYMLRGPCRACRADRTSSFTNIIFLVEALSMPLLSQFNTLNTLHVGIELRGKFWPKKVSSTVKRTYTIPHRMDSSHSASVVHTSFRKT